MSGARLRLGQLLVDARMLSQKDLDEILVLQQSDGRRLGTLLVERGLINETQLTQILSHQLSVPWVSLLHIEFSRQLLNLVPRDVADRFCLVPIYVRHVRGQGQTLYVAMDDPSNEDALHECESFSGLPVRAMIAPPGDIRNAIRVYYGGPAPAPAPARPARAEPPAATPAETQPAKAEPPPSSDPSPDERPRARRSERPARRPSGEFSKPAPAPAPVAEAAPPAAVERTVDLEAGRPSPTPVDPTTTPRPGEVAAPSAIPKPRGGAPRMVSLTLLDGTTITLPAKKTRAAVDTPPVAKPDDEVALTARDLVAALRAISHGADADEIFGGNVRWEPLFAALLSLLLKKHLIADWEFVDEFKKI